MEILVRKPRALPGVVALDQARRSGVFTAGHEVFRAAARAAHGDGAGTRERIEVLLSHRHLRRGDVLAGLRAATIAALPPDRRPLPTVDACDELLTRRPKAPASMSPASGTTVGRAS